MFHLDRALYLLGYIAAQQRVYLIDREHSVVSYTLLLALVEFKTLVMRGAMEEAYGMLETLPVDQLDGCALHEMKHTCSRCFLLFRGQLVVLTFAPGACQEIVSYTVQGCQVPGVARGGSEGP